MRFFITLPRSDFVRSVVLDARRRGTPRRVRGGSSRADSVWPKPLRWTEARLLLRCPSFLVRSRVVVGRGRTIAACGRAAGPLACLPTRCARKRRGRFLTLLFLRAQLRRMFGTARRHETLKKHRCCSQ